jgi:hypothetical protein
MLRKVRIPSPAFALALIALFVGLSSTAVAAGIVPLAKRAVVADNAKKLSGKTRLQIVSTPGPASSIADLFSVKSSPWSLSGGQGDDFGAACDSGQKAVSGGYDNPNGDAVSLDTRPAQDDSGWKVFLQDLSDSAGASGAVYVVCTK